MIPVPAVCVNNNWYTGWQRISIKSGLFSAAFVRSYKFQERLHSLNRRANWMSYNSFVHVSELTRTKTRFVFSVTPDWSGTRPRTVRGALSSYEKKISMMRTENCHPRLSSRRLSTTDVFGRYCTIVNASFLTSCAGKTCQARWEFFAPKLQYFFSFKYIQI